MEKVKKFLACTLMMSSVMMVGAKGNNPDVKGVVKDLQGEPMPYVNVVLLNPMDSTFIEGAVTDEKGHFIIAGPQSHGLLRISSVGFNTQYLNIKNGQNLDVNITLKEDSQLLSEATVVSQLPKTKLTGNSMITSIQGTVLGQSGTAKEMLAKVPGLTSKNDEIEVLGKGAPLFYINGRKVQNLDELKRLRSEEIQNVEVITNPGAQYDATITSVVRIKTIKIQGDGLGFDLNAGNNQHLLYGYSDPSATVNLRYRHNSIDVFGMANYWSWTSVNDSKIEQNSYFLDKGMLRTIEQQNILRNDWIGKGLDYNIGFNWQIADNHSLGMRIERHDKIPVPMDDETESYMKSYLPGEVDVETDYNKTVQRAKAYAPYSWEGNAYYSGKFGKLGVDLNLDFLTNKNREEVQITDYSGKASSKEADLDVNHIETVSRSANKMYAGKLVFSYPIWKGQLNAGTEMTSVTRHNRYEFNYVQPMGNTAGVQIPTTDTEVQENNAAAFVEYSCQIPKVGSVNAGVRYEHVGFDYTNMYDSKKNLSRYTDDFFPTISWSNQWKNWQLAMSYGFKTKRPNYEDLSESINYLNSYSLQQGNPTLKNEKIQEVSANVRWKFINLFAAYERRDDAIATWSYLYNDEGIILLKRINYDIPLRNLAVFLSASPTWGCYSPNWTVGVQKFFVKQTLADPREADGKRVVRYHTPIGIFDLNNTFRLPKSWQIECNANIMTKGDVMAYRMRTNSVNVSAVVQKCWLKNDALCLRASIGDIFQRGQQAMALDCGYYDAVQSDKSRNHKLNITLRYSFNASQSKYKGTGAGKEAQSRMNQ